MRRFLNYVLLGTLVLSLTACGGNDKKEMITEQTKNAKETETQTEIDHKEEQNSEEGDSKQEHGTTIVGQPQQPVPAVSDDDPQVAKIKSGYSEFENNGTYTMLMDSYYEYLKVVDDELDKYQALNQGLQDYFLTNRGLFEEEHSGMLQDVKEDRQMREDQELYYTQKVDTFVKRVDNKLLSFLTDEKYYSGGAHGDSVYGAATFDVQTGKQLNIRDILKDCSGIPDVLETKLMDVYPEIEFNSLSESLRQYQDKDWIWTLDADGMTFYFNHYDLASYAAGRFQARLDFVKDGDLFNPAYSEPSVIAAEELVVFDTIQRDLDQDGVLDQISVYRNPGEYESDGDIEIEVNGKTFSQEIYAYSIRPILIRNCDGISSLLVECSSDNDYRCIYSFTLDQNGAKSAGEVVAGGLSYIYDEEDQSGGTIVLTNPDKFALDTKFDILSTYSATRHYRVGDDGRPEPLEDQYVIHLYNDMQLTTKLELTTDLVDENTHELLTEGETTVKIPAGSKLTMLMTDGKNWVDVRMEDGRVCRIYVDTTEYPDQVGGVDVDQIFDGMMFAG